GHDLARGEDLDLELVVGDFANELAEQLGAAVERVEGLRPARGEPPFQFRHRLRDRRGGDGGAGDAEAGGFPEIATLHVACCRLTPHVVPPCARRLAAGRTRSEGACQIVRRRLAPCPRTIAQRNALGMALSLSRSAPCYQCIRRKPRRQDRPMPLTLYNA